MKKLKNLYKTLKLRNRPEDVADMIVDLLKDDLHPSQLLTIEKAAKGSLRRNIFGYTSMAQEFSKTVGVEKQINKAKEIFEVEDFKNFNPQYVPDIEKVIDNMSRIIHKQVGSNNFLSDRLSKSQRKVRGLDLSKRNYNKKWRFLKRLEKNLQKYQLELEKSEFQMIAKHGLAHEIGYEQFTKDVNTACFIAYYNARCNLRSVFTNDRQTRAYDQISDMLFKRCQHHNTNTNIPSIQNKAENTHAGTNWEAISYIYTGQDVLSHLTDSQKGNLLGKWTTVLKQIAEQLEKVWKENSFDRNTMIVSIGDDSTTWNNTAGAWNKARDQWMNLIHALGMEYVIDDFCFGKVMRLMAADVAAWHQSSGGELDPNTEVWNKLPLPWEVFDNKKKCNKKLVVTYCKEAGLDAEKSGWVAPRTHQVEEYRPTPELVHGVEIASPFLAKVLKKYKFFSGK